MPQNLKTKILESSLGYRLWSAPVNRQKMKAIRHMLEKRDSSEPNILDIGCGPGTNAGIFPDRSYVGLDHNSQYIENAQLKFPNKRFICGDAAQLDLNGEEFSVVLVNSLMHHLDNDECSRLLKGITKVLAKNGVVIVQEPLTPPVDKSLMQFLMKQDRGDYFRSLDEWKSIFVDNAYTITDEDFYDLKVFNLIVGWNMYSVLLKYTSGTPES